MEYDSNILKKLQDVELEILLAIDHVCGELGISYFLDGGSLLGAIRHQGFIPWDDDMDIGMTRADYTVFLDRGGDLLSPEYRICTSANTDGYAPMFAKVVKSGTVFQTAETRDSGFEQGVFVDVFPYDSLAMNPKTAAKQRKVCRAQQTISYLYHSGSTNSPHNGILGGIEKILLKAAHNVIRKTFDIESTKRKFEHWAQIGNKTPNGNMMAFAYAIPGPGIEEKDLLPVKSVPFEGRMLSIPANPEKVLEMYYGTTWRQLPPPEDRKNHAPLKLNLGEPASKL